MSDSKKPALWGCLLVLTSLNWTVALYAPLVLSLAETAASAAVWLVLIDFYNQGYGSRETGEG